MKKLKSLYRHITCAMCGVYFYTELHNVKPKKDSSESKTKLKGVCPQCNGGLPHVESSKNEQDA
ncbi:MULTISPECIES: hypothetical protein [Vibrio]|uniref:hypothetical protein n=1 Tax=Vibrio TaxID=662 RepID=UPI0020BE131B|nr:MULTISPECIES: hypothetical protein [Vibrio]MCK8063373.1 hypothetical protein [Vibrio sp. 1CM7H]